MTEVDYILPKYARVRTNLSKLFHFDEGLSDM